MGIIRLLLALAVVVAHSTPIFGFKLVSGDVAVESFFIISGFYMALILNTKYVGEGSYKLFLSNRLLRIYPIYWIVLILSIGLSVLVVISGGNSEKLATYYNAFKQNNLSPLSFCWIIFGVIFIFFQDWFLFFGVNPTGKLFFTNNFHLNKLNLYTFMFIPQAWTVGLELAFYLIAPFIARKSNLFLLTLMLISLSIKIILFYKGFNYDPWTYRFFPSELFYFILGIFSYRLYSKLKNLDNRYFKVALPLLILITLISPYLKFIAFFDVIYTLLVALLVPFIFSVSKKNKYDSLIGELSYPVYMLHVTLLIIIDKFHLPILQSRGTTLAMVSIIISLILNNLVTKPIEKVRQNRIKNKVSFQ